MGTEPEGNHVGIGLAVEWNKGNREEGEGNEYNDTPSFMDLKLLPADHLHKKCATQFPDMTKTKLPSEGISTLN